MRRVLPALLILTACPRGGTLPSPVDAVPTPVPPVDVARPPVPGVDVPGLLARDGLEREPWEEACCGAGRIALEEVRWAELDGAPPSELVLTTLEYVGEGVATWHHHVYDVSDPDQPRALAPSLEHGGYVRYGYLRVIDPEGDGTDALMVVSEPQQGTPLSIVERDGDALVPRWQARLGDGSTALLDDADGDGILELVTLVPEQGLDAEEGDVALAVHRLPDDRADPALHGVHLQGRLPDLLARTLAQPDLPHRELALSNLALAARAHSVPPDALVPALDVHLDRVASLAADVDRVTIDVLDPGWRATPEQVRRLRALLSSPVRARASTAASLLLQTTDNADARRAALESARADLEAQRVLAEPEPMGFFPAWLTEAERAASCTVVRDAILAADTHADARGELTWGPLYALHCVDAALDLLERPDTLPVHALRGALHTVEQVARYARYDPSRPGLGEPQVDRFSRALGVLRSHPDATLRAEAHRAALD